MLISHCDFYNDNPSPTDTEPMMDPSDYSDFTNREEYPANLTDYSSTELRPGGAADPRWAGAFRPGKSFSI